MGTREADPNALEKSLRRRFRVVESEVVIRGHPVRLLHPASAEDLIDERDFERDERLPYWAELWPSARVLADRVLSMRAGGRTLLELGCGSGLVTTCAALAGFDVVASDYYEDATRFARVNAWRNGARPPRALVLDWRALPTLPRFDVVVASDVLYERPYGALVAQAIAATLGLRGMAFVADPGRVGREEFVRALKDLDLRVAERQKLPYEDGGIKQTITLFEIRWNGASVQA